MSSDSPGNPDDRKPAIPAEVLKGAPGPEGAARRKAALRAGDVPPADPLPPPPPISVPDAGRWPVRARSMGILSVGGRRWRAAVRAARAPCRGRSTWCW